MVTVNQTVFDCIRVVGVVSGEWIYLIRARSSERVNLIYYQVTFTFEIDKVTNELELISYFSIRRVDIVTHTLTF